MINTVIQTEISSIGFHYFLTSHPVMTEHWAKCSQMREYGPLREGKWRGDRLCIHLAALHPTDVLDRSTRFSGPMVISVSWMLPFTVDSSEPNHAVTEHIHTQKVVREQKITFLWFQTSVYFCATSTNRFFNH